MSALLSALGLVFLLATSSSHTVDHEDEDHDHPGSFFCEGGGYNMYCGEGHKLNIKKAWFGRFADDYHNCLPRNLTGNPNAVPRVEKDCGGDAIGALDKSCTDMSEGCVVRVLASELETDGVANPCPDRVPRYLYLEFECVTVLHGGGGASALKPSIAVFGFLSIVLMLVFRRTG